MLLLLLCLREALLPRVSWPRPARLHNHAMILILLHDHGLVLLGLLLLLLLLLLLQQEQLLLLYLLRDVRREANSLVLGGQRARARVGLDMAGRDRVRWRERRWHWIGVGEIHCE